MPNAKNINKMGTRCLLKQPNQFLGDTHRISKGVKMFKIVFNCILTATMIVLYDSIWRILYEDKYR